VCDHYHMSPRSPDVARRVPCDSGGSIVIDRARRLTAIFRYPITCRLQNTGSGNSRTTVTANNLEAMRHEVARPAPVVNRGIIVIDFVEMGQRGQPRKVWWDAFQKRCPAIERARTSPKISELGLVEMSGKRTRESLVSCLTSRVSVQRAKLRVVKSSSRSRPRCRECARRGMTVENEKIELEARARASARSCKRQERGLPRLAEKAVPELDHSRRSEGLESRIQFRVARQDVDRDSRRSRGPGTRTCTSHAAPSGGDRRWHSRRRWVVAIAGSDASSCGGRRSRSRPARNA